MADSRFYESLGPLRLADLIASIEGAVARPEDSDVQVSGVEPIERTRSGALSYVGAKSLPEMSRLAKGAILLVNQAHADALGDSGVHYVVCPDPRRAFAAAAGQLLAERALFSQTRIDPSATLGEGCVIAPSASIGAGAVLGKRVHLGPGSVVGPGVEIGDDSRIEAHCVVRCAIVGARAFLQSAAKIGEAGFSIVIGSGTPQMVPHFGRVVIGNDVLVGANTCIDRGLFGDTTIGDHCKFDNLVHIAHNVTMGEGCVFAGFAAVSGSCVIGKNVMFAGRSGLSDHVTVGDGAIVGAGSAAMHDIPAGEFWFGSPAMPKRDYVRQRMALKRLADRKKSDRHGE